MTTQARPTDPDRNNPGGNGVQVGTEEARAGATPHMTRYVLGWGLALVVVAFVAVLAYYMLRT